MNPADVALVMVRRACPGPVPPTAPHTDAAAEIRDTSVRFPRDSTRALLVVTVFTAVIAYLHGPGHRHPARAVRTAAERGTTTTGGAPDRVGVRTGAMGRLPAGHREGTTTGAVAAGALTPVFRNHLPVGAVAVVLCIVPAVLFPVAVLASAAGPAAGHEDRAAVP
jgi:hypothetical protein